MSLELAGRHFQVCGACKRAWPTWEKFILDPGVRLLGLQVVVINPDINLLVFEHRCGSSISILTKRLRHLVPSPGPVEASARLLGTPKCHMHCLHLEDLMACKAPCSNARDRVLIKAVRRMKKEGAKAAPAEPAV